MVKYLCGRGDLGFCFSSSVSSVGEIICCLDKMVFEANECVLEQRFVVVKGRWLEDKGSEGLICVYAPTDDNDRVSFLDALVQFVSCWDCQKFVIFGDFNVVLYLEESEKLMVMIQRQRILFFSLNLWSFRIYCMLGCCTPFLEVGRVEHGVDWIDFLLETGSLVGRKR